jgi:uncharacterized protein YjdB
MKHFLLLTFAVGMFFKAQSQCTALSQYPLNTLTPTSAWSNIDLCNYAGEYAVINVVAGNVYEFSTMGIHGSTILYDTELTLRNATNALIAYNDDYQATTQSYISWTASYTGTARIHLHEYPCLSNSTCSNIRYKVTAPVGPAPANNNCANATPMTPSAVCNLTNGTTAGATEDAIPDPSCDPGTINDVWYSFNSGNYTSLNLTVNLVSANWIGVELFTGCGTLAQNTTLGGNLGNCDFNTSAPNPTVISGLTPNTNYTFRLFTNVDYDIAGSFTTCLTTPPPPTVTVNSSSVCVGQSVTLTASPSSAGGTYLWSNGATTPSITVTPNATTTYSVTYTNNGTGSGSGTVTVNPLPNINAGVDQTACQGANVTLSGTGGSSYTWDNGVSNGVAFVPNATTTYTVTGTDANGCSNTDQVTVTVAPNPTITGSTTLCPNTTSQLTANANPNANNPWGSSNAAVATVSNTGLVTAVSFGTATITFTNNNGCTATTTLNVTNPTAPAFNPIAAICSGGNLNLPASSTNNIQGTWSPAVNNTQTTTYTFTPSAGQCATNVTLTVNVNPLPTINAGQDQTVCQGANVTLSGTGGTSYTWDNGVSNGVAFAPNATTTYTVTGTDANGCTNTDQVTVTVAPNPTLTGNTVICPNTTSQLTANANPNANNPWGSSNAAVATVSNTGLVTAVSFGTATITFTNNNGCTATTILNVTNPTAPNFNPIAAICSGGNLTLPASSTNNIQGTWSPAVNNTQTTTYTFTPSAGQCATTATLTVNVNALPSINAGQDQTVCQGANVTLSGTGGTSYTWNNGVSNGVAFVPNATTTYTVTGTDANGCSNTDQVTVTVAPNPTLTGNTVICPNTTSQLTANANPNANNPWVSGNPAVATVSNTGLVTAIGFGTSTITFTNNNGCIGTATINVTNPISPTFNPIAAVCAGGNIALPASSSNNVQGTWSPAVNNTQTTTYTFTPSAGQCATTAQLTVTVNPNPSITGSGNVCVGNTLQLTGSGVPAANTPWVSGTPAIGSVSNNGLFTALSAGTSVVTYTNLDGCSASTTVTAQGAVNGAVQQVTACLSYVWQGQSYSQSGSYTDTLQTIAGCDSIVSLNLTISNSITGPTTQHNSCGPYTWNGQTYTQSGTYTYNTTTQNGCDSTATLVLTIDAVPSNVQVSLNQGTFTATGQNAATYAWLDCATNALIPGENSSSFTPAVSGSYAAVISNACGADTSNCEPIEVQGLTEGVLSKVTILPNPTKGQFHVESMNDVIESITIYNLRGEILNQFTVHAESTSVDIQDYANGCYVVKTLTSKGSNISRIIKN